MAAREIEMWIPTSSTLQRLVDLPDFDARRPAAGDRARPPVVGGAPGTPTSSGSTSWTAGGVPGQAVETLVIGRRELLVVDPGRPVAGRAGVDPGRSLAETGGRVVAIAISSADPACAAGADELSERTGAPVFGPPGSAAWLPFPVVELAGPARPTGSPIGPGSASTRSPRR